MTKVTQGHRDMNIHIHIHGIHVSSSRLQDIPRLERSLQRPPPPKECQI